MLRLPGPEQRLQERVIEHAAVEGALEPVQRLGSPSVVIERRHFTKLALPIECLRGPSAPGNGTNCS